MASENAKSDRLNVHSLTRIFAQSLLAGAAFPVSARLPLPFVSDVEPNILVGLNVVVAVIAVIAVVRVDIARDRSEARTYKRTSKHFVTAAASKNKGEQARVCAHAPSLRIRQGRTHCERHGEREEKIKRKGKHNSRITNVRFYQD